jgi:[ribosomal protein S18]-alanine N-acetyltransferase
MQLTDVPQVITIDRLSFDPPWSARSYSYEVNESTYSHMIVLERSEDEKPASGLRRLVQNFSGAPSAEKSIVAYGGLWHIVDEAHISTIASHPEARGKGYGEIVLAGMVRRAITLRAAYIVLEVRVSNVTAQNLYKKYEFQIADLKPRYYHNNGEDAYDMRLTLTDVGLQMRMQQRFAELQAKHGFIDDYSASQPPRGQN